MYQVMSTVIYYGTRKKALAWVTSVGITFVLFAYQFSGRNDLEIMQQDIFSINSSLIKAETRITVDHDNEKTDVHKSRAEDAIETSEFDVFEPYKDFVKKTDFDINGTDVIVFLHVQKTGGSSFGRHLVRDLHLKRDCHRRGLNKKFYRCERPTDGSTWLFSRLSTGWSCGVHPDWTTLTECVHTKFKHVKGGRRFFYITFVREPRARFLSEWKHVSRGATWQQDMSYLTCLGDDYEYPICWTGDDWSGVSLDEFMNCSDNLAHNRQTRMLANLREINCTGKGMDPAWRDKVLLESAKRNLEDMAFFGVTERQNQTQVLFENVFNFRFKVQLFNYNATIASEISLTDEQKKRIEQLNYLDIELYKFALDLFEARYRAITNS